jgi:hypothetical protein
MDAGVTGSEPCVYLSFRLKDCVWPGRVDKAQKADSRDAVRHDSTPIFMQREKKP